MCVPEIPELGQAPDQALNQPLETLGLAASSLGGESRHQLYIHLQDTALTRMVLVLALHFSAISGIILRWMLACIHLTSPPPSSSCTLDNCECSYQKWPLSPQFYSWSMCPGLWLLFSPLFCWPPSKHGAPFFSASLQTICSAPAKVFVEN